MKKRYDKYRDSGVEWIGEIPEGWDRKQIRRICNIKRGASPRPIDDQKYFDDEGCYSWVRISDVTSSERYLTKTEQRLSALGASLSVKLERGSLFLSIAGSVGKPIITEIPCCIHDGFVWFEGLNIPKEFLYYIFIVGECFKGLGKFGTQLNLNSETVSDIFIPLPPLPVQEKIVKYLDHKTSLIDKLISITERKIELLKEKRTALINHAVTKGLDPNVRMKESGIEWIGEIPGHWEVKKLKHFSEITLGKMLTPEDPGGYSLKPYLRSLNIQSERVDLSDVSEMWFSSAELNNLRLSKFDILVNEGGDVGRTSIWLEELDECYIQNSVNRIRIKTGSPYYFYYQSILHHITGYYNSIVNRVSIPHLTKEKLSVVPFILPPVEEQDQIIKYIDEKKKVIDDLVLLEQSKIAALKQFRQTLISEVVTGKINVEDEV